jgi:predicted DsbA family dithiol-disulfide isomerase
MNAIRLDVVSDIVCPWCWLGKRRLDATLDTFMAFGVEVTFRPFQLDPDVPEGGVDYKAYMTAKFGDLSRIAASQEQLKAAGAALGMSYRFEEIAIRPNTFNAHCLIRWASGEGKGAAVVEALFAAHFEELRDVGDPAVLADIAGEAGLDRALVAERLASDFIRAEVRRDEAYFRRLGIGGVPTFIANGRSAVQGAQEAATLERFLRDAGRADNVSHGAIY